MKPTSDIPLSSSLTFNLETADGLQNVNTITDKEAYSGNRSCELNGDNEFSVTYQIPVNDLDKIGIINNIKFSVYVKSDAQKIDNAKIVLCIVNKDKNDEWMSQDLTTSENEIGKWIKKDFEFNVNPQAYSTNNSLLKIYVWNSKKEKFFVDDLNIQFSGIK